MPIIEAVEETFASQIHNEHSTVTLVAAAISLIWYIVVASVCTIGHVQIERYYSKPPAPADIRDPPHLTIIRPIKGTEPRLHECLASTFRQKYPKDKVHIRFCIPSRDEPSLPLLEKLLHEFPSFDAEIFIEDEDELLQHGTLKLGPNPKIRNMSRAYREARGDIVWILDCNVWVGPQTCGRMVQTLQRNKFVHHLPLVVDITDYTSNDHGHNSILEFGGGRLEETFLSAMHAKFYVAINTVLVAPAAVGKSTMFRISHLNSLTHNQGIDYFSYNICEDHLIGDLLWKKKVPAELGQHGEKLGKHGLCFGDIAIQPMSNVSLLEYWNHRVRWIRVRKFTVLIASFVEHGTEPFICSLYGAFAFTTLPIFRGLLTQTWLSFAAFWLLSVSIWCAMDWRMYNILHSGSTISYDEHTPTFARPQSNLDGKERTFGEWLPAWLAREALAFPIWFWAFCCGTTVEWRGRNFWVGMDMKVHEIKNDEHAKKTIENGGMVNGTMNGKARQD